MKQHPVPVKRKPKPRWVFRFYWSTRIFWIVRLNLVIFTELRTIEFTLGLFGAGLLVQFNYGKDKTK